MKISALFDVQGLVALVTGGANGIGFACAEVLAENGAKVCIVDRDVEKLPQAAELLGAFTDHVMSESADVTDQLSIERAVANTLGRFGRLGRLLGRAD